MSPDELLSPTELAEALGISVRTIYNWRVRKVGPPGLKVGRHVRYRKADVESWLAAQAAKEQAAEPNGSIASSGRQ